MSRLGHSDGPIIAYPRLFVEWSDRGAHLNGRFPKFPATVYDKGWAYGVWYCGTAFTRARLYGEYPPTFLKRALGLFPDCPRVLHCPSGLVQHGITVDLVISRDPSIVANAAALPFTNQCFDLVLSDPPYSTVDAQQYLTGPYPLQRAMCEAHRVLRIGGYFGMLHTMYPSYQRSKGWELQALIAVVTGFSKRTRMFSVFQRTA